MFTQFSKTFIEFFFIYRYQTNNKYKLVKIFHQERAQQITCFSAINGFHSCILFLKLWVIVSHCEDECHFEC